MSDESLFREVDEEVRQEQYKQLWSRYGNLFVALCLVVVAAVAGYKGWQYWQVKQSESAAETFFAAAKLAGAGKADDALKQFESIGHPGYGLLAQFRQAATLAATGKPDEAVKIYDGLAANSAAAAPLRDLARIRAAYVLIDTANQEDLAQRVKPFDVTGDPWRHAAREIQALAAWRAADHAAADTMVKSMLGDPETPSGMRQRAQVLAELLIPLVGKP